MGRALYLSYRHMGEDPFTLYHAGRSDVAGRPASSSRYRSFLFACAQVADEEAIEASSASALGMSLGAAPPASTPSKKRANTRMR